MLLRKKINLSKYFLISIICTLSLSFFISGPKEFFGLILVYMATMANHLMLVEGVMSLTDLGKMDERDRPGRKKQGQKVTFLFIGKFLALIIGLTLGIQLMGNKVIIPLFNYVIQIFVLIFCIRSDS